MKLTRRTQGLIDKSNERRRMLSDLHAAAPAEWDHYRKCHAEWQAHRESALLAVAVEIGLK